mgnify:FL=1
MNYILFAITSILLFPYGTSDTKMKIRILPPDEGSLQSTRHLLGRLKNIINNEIHIKDSPIIQKIKKETIKTSIENIPISRVSIPTKCQTTDSCDNSKIREEISEILGVPSYRLRVRVVQK